ncbi:MAG: HEAT repeat domain-containing protein [Planctomycetota bacterium]
MKHLSAARSTGRPAGRTLGRSVVAPALVCALLQVLPGVAVAATPTMAVSRPAAARQDDPKPDKRDEVKTLVATLKGHMGKRGKEDREAVALIDTAIKEFGVSGPKDREALAKVLGEAFKQRRKPNAEGVADNQLYLAAAIALGEMGPESIPVLTHWIGQKDLRDDMNVQRQLILSLGKSKDKAAVKPLIDLLEHHQSIVQAAAAEALANFAHLELEDRKEIFKKVVDQLTAIKGAVDSDPNDTTSRERYDAVRAPMRSVLKIMSKQDFSEPSEWRSWWNNNKNKDWDTLS